MDGASVTTRKLQSAVIGLGLVAVLFVASFAHGSNSPFTGLSGAWAGPRLMLDISTRADQQTVAIQSPGSKMSEVAFSLSRAGSTRR